MVLKADFNSEWLYWFWFIIALKYEGNKKMTTLKKKKKPQHQQQKQHVDR